MRIKVECAPPLPAVKAWFVVPAVSNILGLKASLLSQFPAIQNLSPADLSFSLDGFELLDSSPIDVVRDGELISVTQLVTSIHKRKDRDPTSSPPAKRTKYTSASDARKMPAHTKPMPQTVPSKLLSGSDSDESTELESSSDSEESSTSSDPDSSSDESSSSSSSAPSVRTSKVAPTALRNTTSISVPAIHVPPGQGKVSTQSRNMRRRRKRRVERLVPQAEASNVNETPLGQRKAIETTDSDSRSVPPTIMMASLSNKNKRRGFKQAMSSALPKKIIFEETSSTAASELPFASMPSPDMIAAAPNLFSRLIPPSERQESGKIPHNIFITSVDVEEDLYIQKKKVKRRTGTAEVETVVLDYGEAENVMEHATGREVDWPGVEQRWESLAKVVGPDQVCKGAVLGWKALGINPATFTPEIMLNLGRAVAVDDQLTIQPLLRPGAVSLSFGGVEDEDVEPEEEMFTWDDVLNGDWRIVAVA